MNRRPFTYSDRLAIETMLNESKTINDISQDIKRPSSGIIKEIQRHLTYTFPGTYDNQHPCLKYKTCAVKGKECYLLCKNMECKRCPKLNTSPHVCNGCTTKSGCRYVKQYYKAREAHDEYKYTLSHTRTGLHYDEREMMILKERLCPLIIQTKSVYHSVTSINMIFNTTFTIKSIYRQIKNDYLPVKASDLPRCRRKAKTEKRDRNYKREIEGHSYEDYQKYKESHKSACEVQMDTVEGIKENNAPVLLTLEIVEINFLFIFKIDSQTIGEVVKKLSYFRDIISVETYNKLMEILLTDNGKEFIKVEEILSVSECINVFYCHPYSSYEKGSVENCHQQIRKVIPQSVSLKPYNQKDFDLIASHANSMLRENLDGKCPFDLVNQYIPLEIIEELGLIRIPLLQVCLIPELLGDKNVENIKKYLDEKEIKEANISFLKKD